VGADGVNVDPELRKRVEQIKSSPVQLYREAGDYSNRELVEGIVVSPEDIAAIEVVARVVVSRDVPDRDSWVDGYRAACARYRQPMRPRAEVEAEYDRLWPNVTGLFRAPEVDRPDDPHHRMVQPDHYQRWER
jgi:hypothetical protein